MTFVAACALCQTEPALADDRRADPPRTEAQTIVVTASRTGDVVATGGSVVTRGDLDRLQATTLTEALNRVAGVRAVSTGGAAGGSFVSIRGGEPNFTLVLVDGVRVNDPTNTKGGGFDFTLIEPSLVDSVEVSRGATSAIHGSDALAGVISMHLRSPDGNGLSATARGQAGTAGEVGAGATLGYGWSGGGTLLGGGLYDSGGQTRGSRLHRVQVLGRATHSAGDYTATALGMFARNRRRVFPEDSGGPELAVLRELERGEGHVWTAALSVRHDDAGAFRPHASVSYSGQRAEVRTPAIASGILQGVPAITSDSRLSRFEAIADAVAVTGPLTATVGAAYLNEGGRSRGTVDLGFPLPAGFLLDRTTVSGFAEATLRLGDWMTLNGAVRHDRVSGGPKEWTGRAGAAVRVHAGGPSLFLRGSEGFKLPSFYALASPLIGNPGLLPERSRGVEAGASWTIPGRGDIRVAWFRNNFRDLVDFDPATFSTVNRSRVRTEGVEAEGRVRIGGAVTVAATVTHLKISSSTPLRARPEWQGGASVEWAVTDRLQLGLSSRFDDGFYDSSVPTGLIREDGHSELDASLGYRFRSRFTLSVALRNALDADYREAVGFPAPGRSLRATLSADF